MDSSNKLVNDLMREANAAKDDKKKDDPKPEIDWKTLNDREYRAKMNREFGVNI